MRRILIDAARARQAAKREGHLVVFEPGLETAAPAGADPAVLIALESALEQLTEFDERCARVVEMRFYLGFTVEECADLLATSPKTIKRDWAFARAWLERHLGPRVNSL